MLWLKITVACAVIAFGCWIGWLAAGKYRYRYRFYTQFNDFNERYLSELLYARKPLPVFLKEFPAAGDFKKMIDSHAAKQKNECSFSYLTKEERAACCDYMGMLGRGDAQSQGEYFGAQRQTLAEKKKKCEQEAAKYNALCLKLGLLGALAFVILII